MYQNLYCADTVEYFYSKKCHIWWCASDWQLIFSCLLHQRKEAHKLVYDLYDSFKIDKSQLGHFDISMSEKETMPEMKGCIIYAMVYVYTGGKDCQRDYI